MSTPPPVDSPSLVLSNDPRLFDSGELNARSLVQAPAIPIVVRLSRFGPLVTLYMDWKNDTAWTSGEVMLPLPDGFWPTATLSLPPLYGNVGGALVVDGLGKLRWYAGGTYPGLRGLWTWRTRQAPNVGHGLPVL